MSARLATVTERARTFYAIDDNDSARARCLHTDMVAALSGGICATMLLGVLFLTEFMGFCYAYGASLLFIVATGFLGLALYHFMQEARIGYGEADGE